MMAGLIIEKRKGDGGQPEMENEGQGDPGLSACASDLISAIHAKDEAGVASALKAAFELLESQPQEEAEHTNEPTEGEI